MKLKMKNMAEITSIDSGNRAWQIVFNNVDFELWEQIYKGLEAKVNVFLNQHRSTRDEP